MDASGMNPATAAAFEGMMQQKQVNLLPTQSLSTTELSRHIRGQRDIRGESGSASWRVEVL